MRTRNRRIVRTNWSKTNKYTGLRQIEVSRAKEVSRVIKFALKTEKKVYCRGREHHWGGCGESDENTIILKINDDYISEIETTDDPNLAFIEIGASVRLRDLNLHLAKTNWAIENMGAIAEQNVSALISTNTHGTHPDKGGFATVVQALTFVDSQGNIKKSIRGTESWHEAKYILGSVGKAGIITRLKLKLVPSFNLEVIERMIPNVEALSQANINRYLCLAKQNNGYVRWFLFPNSGTGKIKQNNYGYPLDTVETGFSQITTWQHTTESGMGRGWFRALVEGFVANYVTRKIDKLLDKDFMDLEPDWLHKIIRLIIKFMNNDYRFIGRSDLALTAEPNIPIKSQIGSHTSELYFRIECAEYVLKAVLAKIDYLASVGKSFIWKPMRVRVMASDHDSFCSQVFEANPNLKNTYMTMDIDIYDGQYLGSLPKIMAAIRSEADKAIARYNQENNTEYPLTSFHLGKVPPLLPEEYEQLFRNRPGIKKFIEKLNSEGSLVFFHADFVHLFGLNEK